MKKLIRLAALSAALGASMLSGAWAQVATALPPVQQAGGVEYLSGGIGKDESAAIENATRQWPLTLEFAVKDRQHADFVAGVEVVVRDAKGHTALRATTDGPFLLARLTPGSYAVDATLDGKALHQRVLVKRGAPAKVVFVWPAGTAVTAESRS